MGRGKQEKGEIVTSSEYSARAVAAGFAVDKLCIFLAVGAVSIKSYASLRIGKMDPRGDSVALKGRRVRLCSSYLAETVWGERLDARE